MASSRTITTSSIFSTLLLLTFSTPAAAITVGKQAAIGIGVSLGALLAICVASILYLKCSPKRKAERAARRAEHGEVTHAEAIEFHERQNQKNFNIWDYDHDAVMAKKKALREGRADGGGTGTGIETGLNQGTVPDGPGIAVEGHGPVETVR